MEDRYLFRGKTISGEWVTGFLAVKDGKYYISNKAGRPFAYEIRPETISQCTGLKDKNGELIFENNIVRHYNKPSYPDDYVIGLIYFDKYNLNFKRTSKMHDTVGLMSDCIYEVIGNKFDNPELLEVQE